MNNWQQDKRWSDKFLPEIKSILGLHLIAEPPIEEDAERNTDLMVLRMEPVRIGCRVRKYSYLEKYGHQFTIRSGRPSGIKTELTKIIEGWGDFFFYGFCNAGETKLEQWILGDLKAFRIWFNRELVNCNKGSTPGYSRNNFDGSSDFIAFDLSDIPNFVIANSLVKAA